jgi:hypothetical protein
MDEEWSRDRLFNACDGMENDAVWLAAHVAKSKHAVDMNGEGNVRTMLSHLIKAIRNLGEESTKIETPQALRQSLMSIMVSLLSNPWDTEPLAVGYDLLGAQRSSTAPLPQNLDRSLKRALADCIVWRIQLAAPLKDRGRFERALRKLFSGCTFYNAHTMEQMFLSHKHCVGTTFGNMTFKSNGVLRGRKAEWVRTPAEWAEEAGKAMGMTAEWEYIYDQPCRVRYKISQDSRVLYKVRRGQIVTGKVIPNRRAGLPGWLQHAPRTGNTDFGYSTLGGYRFLRTCTEGPAYDPTNGRSHSHGAASAWRAVAIRSHT